MGDARPEVPSAGKRRPWTVSVAAVILVGLGLFEGMVVASVAICLLFGTEATATAAPLATDEPFGPPMDVFIRHDVELVAVQAAVGAAALVGGVGVWLGWPWARRSGQVAMVVHGPLSLGVGVLMAVSLRSPVDNPVVSGAFLFFRGAAVAVGGAWAALAAVPIWLLERPDADAWLGGRRRARRPAQLALAPPAGEERVSPRKTDG